MQYIFIASIYHLINLSNCMFTNEISTVIYDSLNKSGLSRLRFVDIQLVYANFFATTFFLRK